MIHKFRPLSKIFWNVSKNEISRGPKNGHLMSDYVTVRGILETENSHWGLDPEKKVPTSADRKSVV